MISDTMNSVCDNEVKKRLYEYDKSKY